MDEEGRLLLKIISSLLQYPDEGMMASLALTRKLLKSLKRTEAVAKSEDFLQYLESTPLLPLRENYTQIFDLHPPTCLNLTYHRWGDGKERANALLHLLHLYKNAGYEVLGEDIPDYLPMILEFLSICPGNVYLQIIEEYTDQVTAITSRLQEMGSPYGLLFEAISMLFTKLQRAGGHGNG
ncbi:MAG: nitrate reductase molybdenum cofactor assembly chaperone [Deltaproteobacteria bacterium]|nr:nitrate reductase molybdenum cofactor assembly chaperone [Deltaproteobacteria bacterium]